MRRSFFGGGVGLPAFLFSVCVHGAVFFVFSMIHVSRGGSGDVHLEPSVVTAAQVQKAVSVDPVVPKPMVKRVDIGSGGGKRALEIDTGFKNKPVYSKSYPGGGGEQLDGGLLGGQFKSDPLTEFFGSGTNLRKICYVVDASGSMQGRLGMVRKNLKESIAKLAPDQFFYVIFFRGDGLVESGKGVLVRATSTAKSQAYDFIDSVRFEGPTNAISAIRRSMKIKDPGGQSVQQIYFLSDGFDYDSEYMPDFAGMIEKMRKRLAPAVRINTIGIWVERQDEKILRSIAGGSGGEYVGVD